MWARGLKLANEININLIGEVAPHVGAWIETAKLAETERPKSLSRPMWARGLKRVPRAPLRYKPVSRPMWARGLKRRCRQAVLNCRESRPMWARGLKLLFLLSLPSLSPSRPMWARGLKQYSCGLDDYEIRSRAPCGRVD